MRQNCPYESSPAARHYHPTLSIWLSVDPMADKYPGVSPYAYCGNNPVRLVDPDGRKVVNPYTDKVSETKNIINRIEQLIKEGNCDVGLAKAALRHQKKELRKFEWLEGKANVAIEALKEDEVFFKKLNNLQDEHTNPIDVYITYNFNMSPKREAQCNISATVWYERDPDGNIINVHLLGFKLNRVYIELSGMNDALNVCHEGGHLEYEVPIYSEYLLWQIQTAVTMIVMMGMGQVTCLEKKQTSEKKNIIQGIHIKKSWVRISSNK